LNARACHFGHQPHRWNREDGGSTVHSGIPTNSHLDPPDLGVPDERPRALARGDAIPSAISPGASFFSSAPSASAGCIAEGSKSRRSYYSTRAASHGGTLAHMEDSISQVRARARPLEEMLASGEVAATPRRSGSAPRERDNSIRRCASAAIKTGWLALPSVRHRTNKETVAIKEARGSASCRSRGVSTIGLRSRGITYVGPQRRRQPAITLYGEFRSQRRRSTKSRCRRFTHAVASTRPAATNLSREQLRA